MFIKSTLREGWGLFGFAFWGFTLGLLLCLAFCFGGLLEEKRIIEGKTLKGKC
jgi:hypothetical protein